MGDAVMCPAFVRGAMTAGPDEVAHQVPLRAPGSSAQTKHRVFLVAALLIIITYVCPYSDMWRRSYAIRWRSYAALGPR